MKKLKKLIIACDGESASGKSTAAKLISKKYNLTLVNSGLLYRYASKLSIKHKPKNLVSFLKKKFDKISYQKIAKEKLHSEKISIHTAHLAKKKAIRQIINKFQKNIIRNNKRICVEGRDIASKILSKNPKYDLAFYFKCNLNTASFRRFKELKKINPKIKLKEVKKALRMRNILDSKRKNSPLLKHRDSIEIDTGKLNKQAMLTKMIKSVERIKKIKWQANKN